MALRTHCPSSTWSRFPTWPAARWVPGPARPPVTGMIKLAEKRSDWRAENWGLITYRAEYLLLDEATASLSQTQLVTYLVCHEVQPALPLWNSINATAMRGLWQIAHMWFGNLVTMAWWNEVWLNEGFATYLGKAAVVHLHQNSNVRACDCCPPFFGTRSDLRVACGSDLGRLPESLHLHGVPARRAGQRSPPQIRGDGRERHRRVLR